MSILLSEVKVHALRVLEAQDRAMGADLARFANAVTESVGLLPDFWRDRLIEWISRHYEAHGGKIP